jgi:DNA topoisomerase VI subunit B
LFSLWSEAKSFKMRHQKIIKYIYFLLFLAIGFSSYSQTSEEIIINNVQEALKSSSSRELAKYLSDRVEIKLENEKKDYSANQAEIVLKQ